MVDYKELQVLKKKLPNDMDFAKRIRPLIPISTNGYKRQATSNELACDILTQDNLPVYKGSDYKASSIKRQAA